MEGVASDDESSSDDDHEWRQELKKRQKEKNATKKQPKFYELKTGEEFTSVKKKGDERRKKTYVKNAICCVFSGGNTRSPTCLK